MWFFIEESQGINIESINRVERNYSKNNGEILKLYMVGGEIIEVTGKYAGQLWLYLYSERVKFNSTTDFFRSFESAF